MRSCLLRNPCLAAGLAAFAWMAAAAGAAAGPSPAEVGRRLFLEPRFANPATGVAVSCSTCHVPDADGGTAFCDSLPRSHVPPRSDGVETTPRNSPSLLDAFTLDAGAAPLHFDGEFATPEGLVVGTYLGRNFGWRADEAARARHHFAEVIRTDRGDPGAADRVAREPYAALLRELAGAAQAAGGIDVTTASDEAVLDACARLVVAYGRTLRLSRDAEGRFDGTAYDTFLAVNRLPRSPRPDETPREYTRRLAELVFALKAPRYVGGPSDSGRTATQAAFGPEELRGLRIFLKAAVGPAQRSGAGNCAECHVPPQFTDYRFHNTGVAQDEYDAIHGSGAFARLVVPTLAERAAAPERWLPASAEHPEAPGLCASAPRREDPRRVDLGLWNVYANPDRPAPQDTLETLLNPGGTRSREAVAASALAAFKTSTVRNLGHTAPYLHTGGAATLDDVVETYVRTSTLAHAGQLRNAPPEFFAMRLAAEDVEPLVRFLRSLDERAEAEARGQKPEARGRKR